MTPAELVWALRGEGFLGSEAAQALPPAAEAEAPWYLRLVQGVGGWLAALFALMFLGMAFSRLFDSLPGTLAVAGLGLGAAWAMTRQRMAGDFRGQLALALYLTGLAALAFASHNLLRSERPATALFGGLALVVAWLMPLRLQRFFGALLAVFAFAFAAGRENQASTLGVLALVVVGLWLGEWRWTAAGLAERLVPGSRAAALALLVLPLQALSWRAAAPSFLWGHAVALAPALVAAALVGCRGEAAAVRLLAVIAAAAAAVLAAWAPGVPLALLVAALAYGAGSRPLLMAALAAGVGYLGQFYYQMQISLLEKSYALLAAGAGLLLLRWLALRLWRETGHG